MLSRNALADGYNGPITVSAVINGQGSIAYLTVDAAGETEGLG
jgi:Na+-translocating ferredoxin:NAD+ oxidoreductase RnfG subunit